MSNPRHGRLKVRVRCQTCGQTLTGITNTAALERLRERMPRDEAERTVRQHAARMLLDQHKLSGQCRPEQLGASTP